MPAIPAGDATPLIRTDFSDEPGWRELARAAAAPSLDGFRASLAIVDDRAFEGASAAALARSTAGGTGHACLFIADAMAMRHAEHPLLCVELRAPGRSFRIVPGEVWGVENNLAIANMDFEEFADAVDGDGIFRGFR
jgi:hypothetical protein